MKIPRDINGDFLAKLLITKYKYKMTRQTGSHIRLTTHLRGEHHITVPHHGAPRLDSRGTQFTPTRKIWRNSLRQFRHTRRGYPPTCCFGGIRRSATAFYRIQPRLKKPWYSAKADKPLKIGTLNSILKDISSYLEIEREDLIKELFYKR